MASCTTTLLSAARNRVELVSDDHDSPAIPLTCYATGRELGSDALHEYISIKAVQWNIGEKLDWHL